MLWNHFTKDIYVFRCHKYASQPKGKVRWCIQNPVIHLRWNVLWTLFTASGKLIFMDFEMSWGGVGGRTLESLSLRKRSTQEGEMRQRRKKKILPSWTLLHKVLLDTSLSLVANRPLRKQSYIHINLLKKGKKRY